MNDSFIQNGSVLHRIKPSPFKNNAKIRTERKNKSLVLSASFIFATSVCEFAILVNFNKPEMQNEMRIIVAPPTPISGIQKNPKTNKAVAKMYGIKNDNAPPVDFIMLKLVSYRIYVLFKSAIQKEKVN